MQISLQEEVEILQRKIDWAMARGGVAVEMVNKKLFEIVPSSDNYALVIAYLLVTKRYSMRLNGRRTLYFRALQVIPESVKGLE